jgi:hypothetical protein
MDALEKLEKVFWKLSSAPILLRLACKRFEARRRKG